MLLESISAVASKIYDEAVWLIETGRFLWVVAAVVVFVLLQLRARR